MPQEDKIPDHIVVNRTVRPFFPDWADLDWINNPKFITAEVAGPRKFNAQQLIGWDCVAQKTGNLSADIEAFYKHVRKNRGLFHKCLGLHDLEGIEEKGFDFYQEQFKGKSVCGLKSVVRSRTDGELYLPFLICILGDVYVDWSLLYGVLNPNYIILHNT